MGCELEQVFLFLAGRRQLVEIRGVHDHMAGRAGHDPLTGAFQRLSGCPGHVQQALTWYGIHFLVQAPIGPEKTHYGHAFSFS